MERILSLLIGYLFGCILTAEIVSHHYTGKPIREIGSKNPGMANVMSNVGKVPGALVLIGDIVKTGLAIIISYLLFSDAVGFVCVHYAGIGAILGHNFPFWRKFHGGKGVTVTCTWIVMGFGIWGILCDLTGAVTVFLTGWLPLAAVVIGLVSIPTAFLTSGTETGLLAIFACALMFSRHWHGLRRIIRGEEAPHLKLIGRKSHKDEEKKS